MKETPAMSAACLCIARALARDGLESRMSRRGNPKLGQA